RTTCQSFRGAPEGAGMAQAIGSGRRGRHPDHSERRGVPLVRGGPDSPRRLRYGGKPDGNRGGRRNASGAERGEGNRGMEKDGEEPAGLAGGGTRACMGSPASQACRLSAPVPAAVGERP